MEPEIIDKCISMLRPYHGILLMVRYKAGTGQLVINDNLLIVSLVVIISQSKYFSMIYVPI